MVGNYRLVVDNNHWDSSPGYMWVADCNRLGICKRFKVNKYEIGTACTSVPPLFF